MKVSSFVAAACAVAVAVPLSVGSASAASLGSSSSDGARAELIEAAVRTLEVSDGGFSISYLPSPDSEVSGWSASYGSVASADGVDEWGVTVGSGWPGASFYSGPSFAPEGSYITDVGGLVGASYDFYPADWRKVRRALRAADLSKTDLVQVRRDVAERYPNSFVPDVFAPVTSYTPASIVLETLPEEEGGVSRAGDVFTFSSAPFDFEVTVDGETGLLMSLDVDYVDASEFVSFVITVDAFGSDVVVPSVPSGVLMEEELRAQLTPVMFSLARSSLASAAEWVEFMAEGRISLGSGGDRAAVKAVRRSARSAAWSTRSNVAEALSVVPLKRGACLTADTIFGVAEVRVLVDRRGEVTWKFVRKGSCRR